MFFINVMDLIGTAAFAVSGVLVGVNNRLDLFGVFVLSIATASGGGLIRDVILGKELPVFFTQPRYFITIVISMVITCLTIKYIRRILFVIKVFDAVGLGVFTIVAAYNSIREGVPLIGVLFLAVLTGIGGGVTRDILVNDVPLVFRSEIYALASLLGALTFYLLYPVLGINLNVYLCIFIVFAIRILAVRFNLNLPIIHIKEEKEDPE